MGTALSFLNIWWIDITAYGFSVPLLIFLFMMLSSAVVPFFYEVAMRKHEDAVGEAKRREREMMLNAARQGAKAVEKLHKRITELEGTMTEIANSAIQTGNIILNGDHGTVVAGPGTVSIIRETNNSDPELANALKTVLGFIENTQNEKAAEYFGKFVEQVDLQKRDKTILQVLWDQVLLAAPAVKEMGEAVAAIAKIFK